MLSFTLSGNISMDNHQWRLSQAYTYAFHISIHISITSIPYHPIFLLHVNLFLLHVLCLWHIPFSILFLYFYTYHVFIFHSCHMSFSMFLFFFRLHIMSLVYVFFIFRFYDLLHSMYYYIYFTYIVRSYSIIYFVLLYSFCTCLMLT